MTSTKQFVWSVNRDKLRRYAACEERDASGALTKKFYERGQTNSAIKYFYNKDQTGSIREMTDNSGAVQAQYAFDPYGRVTKISEAAASDFGFGGYYFHSRSELNITRARSYNASFGRFLNRDPIEENGGTNLFQYAANEPINEIDPSGTNPLVAGLPFVPGVGEVIIIGGLLTIIIGGAVVGIGHILKNQTGKPYGRDDAKNPSNYDDAKEHNDRCRQVKADCLADLNPSDPKFWCKLSSCMAASGCNGFMVVQATDGTWFTP